jgi:hypothetical protein
MPRSRSVAFLFGVRVAARDKTVRDEAYFEQAMAVAEAARQNWHAMDEALKATTIATLRAALIDPDGWPHVYVNSETGRVYTPHHDRERSVVFSDTPRYLLIRGGEGGGKSVAGIIKTLNRIRRGCSGVMLGPNLPHTKRSLWPEFRRWCPWNQVVKKHQRFGHLDWEPHEPFNIVFKNDAILHVTGIENPGSLEGPNLNFAHFDEARHHPDAKALKVLDGRVRIPGPKGEPPQIFLTTTPALNWLYEYFGPPVEDDPYLAFKKDARDVILLTKDNEGNLFEGFTQSRAQTLTEKESRVLLEAQWEDLTDGQPFLPDISWWDSCKEKLPPLQPNEPVVLGLDAATGRTASSSDCFAILAVTRHPDRSRSNTTLAVRYAKVWQVRAGQKIDYQGTWDYPGPERELLRLCGWEMDADGLPVPRAEGGLNVLAVVYDPTELHDMSQRLYKAGVAWFKEFSQGILRNEADRQLLELIKEHRVIHDGDPDLRDHIRNADRKTDDSGHRLRIVKRTDSQKVDLAIALSMASHEALRLNL